MPEKIAHNNFGKTDKEIKKFKGYKPEMTYVQRKEVLKSIRYVNKVVASKFILNDKFLKHWKPNLAIFVGIGAFVCKNLGICARIWAFFARIWVCFCKFWQSLKKQQFKQVVKSLFHYCILILVNALMICG